MLQLKNTIKVLTRYTGKSKFPFWGNIRPGDIIVISVDIKDPGRTSHGLYTTNIDLLNTRSDEQGSASITMLKKYLDMLTYEEHNEIIEAPIQE